MSELTTWLQLGLGLGAFAEIRHQVDLTHHRMGALETDMALVKQKLLAAT